MTPLGLTFNDKHSFTNFGLYIEEKKINLPSKKKIKDSVPYRNSSYDFSTVGSDGDIVFNDRNIPVKLLLSKTTMYDLYSLYTAVSEWLLGAGQNKLIFDFMPGYFFLAEVEDAPDFDEFIDNGDLSINFVCKPYKYSTELYGDLLWNNVDFLLPDYIQPTKFNVNGTLTVTIGLPGSHSIVPNVIVDSNMSCKLNNYTANFTTTSSKDYQFKLKPGMNTIQITGTGDIDFQFRKEVL